MKETIQGRGKQAARPHVGNLAREGSRRRYGLGRRGMAAR